ncbi:MAG: hypothetical protein PWP34_1755 [Desulfuromonadales bacterium]|nr:hypothetical protein [Desulfuromonadales bacterium]
MKVRSFWWLGLVAAVLLLPGCGRAEKPAAGPEVPRGYVATLEVEIDGQVYGFGPFVGYYFRPLDPADLSRVAFICFNERRFYTLDLPENSRLFEGEAVLVRLPDAGFSLPDSGGRIRPVSFPRAPAAWLATRPAPQDEFVHFHSLYNAAGPSLRGYWLRHRALAAFTYDMGGRVGPKGPLYHRAVPGVDRDFAHLVEFDRGPASAGR